MLDNLANHQMTELKGDILASIEASRTASNSVQATTSFSEMLSRLTQLAYEQKSVDIVKSLDFPTRGERQSNVVEAFPHTYEWIFEQHQSQYKGTWGLHSIERNGDKDSCSDSNIGYAEVNIHTFRQLSFLNWLRSGNDIYWISGKAGSGKSTLMRFIVEDVRTRMELQSWAGQAKVVTASCFFSGLGGTLQKSEQGLLQSLLYQVLSQCSDLVPAVCSSRYHTFGANARIWPKSEITKVFQALAKHTPSLMFCFFIDGLDEFDGNHKDIVRMVENLAKSPNIKICLSSRPLYVFLKAFGDCSGKLMLEELTKPDIKHYVNRMLADDSDYTRLAAVDTRCKQLIDDIIANAQGVFLWVRLVVNELLLGLGSEDDIGDLQKRLRRLPNDLEDYYRLMLPRIHDIYREEAAELFQLTKEATGPLSLLAIAVYRIEKIDPGLSFGEDFKKVNSKDSEKESLRLLSTRCQGLLIANGHTVSYLHETVRVFLNTTQVENLLKGWTSPNFSAERTLLKAVIVQMKMLATQAMGSWPPGDTEEGVFLGHFRDFVLYAHRLEDSYGLSDVPLIDEFDLSSRILGECFQIARKMPIATKLYWTNLAFEIGDRPPFSGSMSNFLDFAVQEGLPLYVNLTLQTQPRPTQPKGHRPLLDRSLQPTFFRLLDPSSRARDHKFEMVKVLLVHGARPTETLYNDDLPRWRHMTIFASFLRQIYLQKSEATDDQYRIMELMIEYGAISGLRRWHVPISDDQVFLERFTVPYMLRTVLSKKKTDHLEKIILRKQPPSLRLWQGQEKLIIYVSRCLCCFDDIMFWICFILPTILWNSLLFTLSFIIIFSLAFITLPISMPGTLVWGGDDLLAFTTCLGLMIGGLLTSIFFVILWQMYSISSNLL